MFEVAVIEYLLTAAVTVLTGDRVYQGIRARRNGATPATKADMKELHTKMDGLGSQLEFHLGYHDGLKDR